MCVCLYSKFHIWNVSILYYVWNERFLQATVNRSFVCCQWVPFGTMRRLVFVRTRGFRLNAVYWVQERRKFGVSWEKQIQKISKHGMIKCFFKYVFHLKNLLYQFLKSLWSLGKLIRRYGTFIPFFYKNVNENVCHKKDRQKYTSGHILNCSLHFKYNCLFWGL